MSAVRSPGARRLRRPGGPRLPRSGGRRPGGPRLPRSGGRRRFWRHRRRALGGLMVLAVVLACGWLWLRSSSLVAVRQVSVTGLAGADASQIRQALVARARGMTTLSVDVGSLRAAVSGYAEVQGLRVSTSFPHGLRVHVVEHIPVGVVRLGDREVVVDQSGALLPDAPISGHLPLLQVGVGEGQQSLQDRGGAGAQAIALLAAAPWQMLTRLAWVRVAAGDGLVAGLRSGPELVFGDATRLALKWAAVDAVLADGSAAGASYVDVTDPARPAAGTGQDAPQSPTAATAQAGTAGPSTSTSG
jgi:cell division protein FtsQ